MIADKLKQRKYDFHPAKLQVLTFHTAVRSGNLVYTSGQVPWIGDEQVKGKVGGDLSVVQAAKAAEMAAVNCLQAVAAVADVDSIVRIVKVLGMVNVAEGFEQISDVINGATDLLNFLFGADNSHARSAVGVTLTDNWAVEVELIAELRA